MSVFSADADLADTEITGFALDGGMMLWAGLSFGTASFLQYLTLTGRLHLPNPAWTGLIWMGAVAVFIMGGVVFKLGSDRKRLSHPSVQRFRAIWLSLIFGGFVVTAALIAVMVRSHLGSAAAFVSAPVMTAVYGVGWRIAGVMSGRKIFIYLSLASFAAAIGLGALAGTAEQSLAYASALVVFAIIPGALLMRPNA
ncbi:MAG: hypothetical protein ACXU8U_02480 [Asticcacaulis sp.]